MEAKPDKHQQYANVIGLDLGKLSDPSALCLIRWPILEPPLNVAEVHFRRREPLRRCDRQYKIETLKRWVLGTRYRVIVQGVIKFLLLPEFTGSPPLLVVDATGVGEAVCEMFLEELSAVKVPGGMLMVVITGGKAVTHTASGRWHVAKSRLASVLRRLLGSERVKIEATLAQSSQLMKELRTFTDKINAATKNVSFEAWRDSDKDDLVLAVAIGLWAAETVDWPPAVRKAPEVLRP